MAIVTKAKTKKNPTTTSTDRYGGKTTIHIDDQGVKHVKYSLAGQDTYKKYSKEGKLTGGYQQNTFGSFGSPDGGKKIPIKIKNPDIAPKKKTPKNPTTIVDKTIYGGDRDVKHIDKEGNTHITNKHNGKTTYVRKDKDGIATDGWVKDDMGKITYAKSGKLPEVKVTPSKKETAPVKTGSGKTVSELWKEKTGTSWSEAKKQGLTDGSAKANLALMAKLKSGEYKPKTKPKTKVETKVESKISSNIKPNEVGPYYSTDKVEDPNKGKMGPFDDPNKPKLKKGGSIKSKITAVKSKIKAKIKSKIMAIKKPLLKARDGIMTTPQATYKSNGQATKYTRPIVPSAGGTPKNVSKPAGATKNFKRGGSVKMKAGGTMKMKTGGMVNSNKKVLVKAMYGRAMKPTMMKKGGTTKKK